jgi:hypothetical protein
MDHYAQGTLLVWTMPDNFSDLYRLPPSVTRAIKDQVMRDFPVRVDGLGQVALFAYDNNTFIVESYLSQPTDVTVSLNGGFNKIKNLLTGEVLSGQNPEGGHEAWPRTTGENREIFNVQLPPHSYRVFQMEAEPSRVAQQ